jgi:hypothetical protein
MAGRRLCPDCLRGLLSQGYPNLRVVVADDRSTDRTGEIVRDFAPTDGRVALVRIDDLPPGWIGKTHALAVAARDVDAEYLLFIDSDVRLAPGAINAVMRKVCEDNLDFVSLWPTLELLSPAERLLTPPAGWLLSFWALLGAGADVSQVRLGNGQFMLFSRRAYARIGGHTAVQAELAEDAIMAERIALHGLSRWAGLGRGLYVTSRSGSFGRTINAVARVLIGSLCTQWHILASTQIVLGGCILPWWLLPFSAALAWIYKSPVALVFVAAGVVHLAAMHYVLLRLFSLTLVRRASLLLFPIGCLLLIGVLVWSWLIMTGRGRVRWGNTRYRVNGSRIEAALAPGG